MKLRKAEDMSVDEHWEEKKELYSGPLETIHQYRQRLADAMIQSQDESVYADPNTSYWPQNDLWGAKNEDTLTVFSTKRKSHDSHLETAGKRSRLNDQGSNLNADEVASRGPVSFVDFSPNRDNQCKGVELGITPVPPLLVSGNDILLSVVQNPESVICTSMPLASPPAPDIPEILSSPNSKPPSGRGPLYLDKEIVDMGPSSSSHRIPDDRVDQASTRLPHVNQSRLSHEKLFSMAGDNDDSIESFTVELNTPQLHKKVLAIKQPEGAADAISPISSFSAVKESKVHRREMKRLPQAFHQPLHLVPLAGLGGRSKVKPERVHEPPHSPIEDVSVVRMSLPRVSFSEDLAKKGPADNQSIDINNKAITKTAERTSHKRNLKVPLESSYIGAKSSSSAIQKPIDDADVIYVSSSPSPRASSPATAPSDSDASKKHSKTAIKPAAKSRLSKGKEKSKPMTPFEFAQMLQAKSAEVPLIETRPSEGPSTEIQKKKKVTVKFLSGKNIFYTRGDMKNASETTRGRMKIIVKFGGNLMPQFDPKVTTHIITDTSIPPTLRALGLKTLKDVPEHIPTVKWSWVLSVIGKETYLTKDEIERRLEHTWMHAAFSGRVDAGYRPQKTVSISDFKLKGKARASSHTNDPPVMSFVTSTDPASLSEALRPEDTSTSSNHLPSIIQPKSDHLEPSNPLDEIYLTAEAEELRDDGWSSLGEPDDGFNDSDIGEAVETGPIKLTRRECAGDQKPTQVASTCANQDIIDKLSELMELHKAKVGDDDRWRAFSYNKCIRALRSYPQRIKSYEEARSIQNVGEKTARKIEEILKTGDLRRIQHEKTEDVMVTRIFQGIYGVGQTTATQWFAAGCRKLDDIRRGKGDVKLTVAQEIGLRYYDDINSRMPREEAKAIFDLIKPIALSIDNKLFVEIMGSYRRGKQTCGDIDILVTRSTDDGNTHSGLLPRLLQALRKAGILTEDLAIPDDLHDLETVYRGLCKVPSMPNARQRRIDILCVPWISRGAALAYYTGDDIFNREMRWKANKMGYSLNQRGLFGNVVRDPHDRRLKLNDGVLVASETEEEIFRILEIPWKEPHERVRG